MSSYTPSWWASWSFATTTRIRAAERSAGAGETSRSDVDVHELSERGIKAGVTRGPRHLHEHHRRGISSVVAAYRLLIVQELENTETPKVLAPHRVAGEHRAHRQSGIADVPDRHDARLPADLARNRCDEVGIPSPAIPPRRQVR